jgi:triphosphoribosyl-dephospho-CoA synthase
VLLLGPLVAADRSISGQVALLHNGQESSSSLNSIRPETWASAIGEVLDSFDAVDGANVFQAIAAASAGGLGKVDELDVHESRSAIDLIAAMKLASDRDRIAMQYAVGFADLFDNVVPIVNDSIQACGDVLQGICRAHIRLLAAAPDSLISRKNGEQAAADIMSKARLVDIDDPQSRRQFDGALVGPLHQLNPGATADLIVASLYVLLRTPNFQQSIAS